MSIIQYITHEMDEFNCVATCVYVFGVYMYLVPCILNTGHGNPSL